MRYIGSKKNLLKNIDLFIRKNIKEEANSFIDAFSGSATVGSYFKSNYQIISNDNLYFSYLLQKIFIEFNSYPSFCRLKNKGINCPFEYFNSLSKGIAKHTFNQFSDGGTEGRKYFSEENGQKIDLIIKQTNDWLDDHIISKDEKDYIFGSLIFHIPSFSNIGGTYGAYLKSWDKRALKKFIFHGLPITNNGKNNYSYCNDVNDFIAHAKGDILYLDPPYNNRQYAPNYHLLETIAREDFKNLRGKTGLRDYLNQKSDFCIKSKVHNALQNILEKTASKHIVMSYSSDGIMSAEEIEQLFCQCLVSSSFVFEKIPYRRFKRTSSKTDKVLYEYLFYGKK